MWILQLNDMRTAKVEILDLVASGTTREALERLIERETVETYKDDNWAKTFRQFGPLEWFNRPIEDDPSFVDVGTREEFTAAPGQSWDCFGGLLRVD